MEMNKLTFLIGLWWWEKGEPGTGFQRIRKLRLIGHEKSITLSFPICETFSLFARCVYSSLSKGSFRCLFQLPLSGMIRRFFELSAISWHLAWRAGGNLETLRRSFTSGASENTWKSLSGWEDLIAGQRTRSPIQCCNGTQNKCLSNR